MVHAVHCESELKQILLTDNCVYFLKGYFTQKFKLYH